MGRRASFDLDDVVAAALALARAEGFAAVALRPVADRLGVTAMALYRVVPDAEALRRAVADAAALEPGGSVAAWAVAAHRELGRTPGMAAFVLGCWTELPRWLDVVERFLGEAAADGIDGPEAVARVNAVFAYVLARAQLRDQAAAAPARRLAPLDDDPARFPRVRANRKEFATARTERHFVFGLDALLGGLGRRGG